MKLFKYFIILLVSFLLLPLSCQSGNVAKNLQLETFDSNQIANLKGTYTADYNGQNYTVVVDKIPGESKFIVAGFFDSNRELWLNALNKTVSKSLETSKTEVCNELYKICNHQSQIERYSSIEKCMRALPLSRFIQKPEKDYGLLFQMSSKSNWGDKFERMLNEFFSLNDYRVEDISLNDKKELSSITFKENGYVQLWRSKIFTFQKRSNESLDILTNYIQVTNELHNAIKNEADSFYSCLN